MSSAEKALFEWRAHPASAQKLRSAAVAACLGGLSAAVGLFYGLFFGLMSAALLVGGTLSHWTPRRYAAYADRLEVRYPLIPRPAAYRWDQFRGCLRDSDTLTLSRQRSDGALARVRGLRVAVPRGQESAADWIRERVERGASDASSNAFNV